MDGEGGAPNMEGVDLTSINVRLLAQETLLTEQVSKPHIISHIIFLFTE